MTRIQDAPEIVHAFIHEGEARAWALPYDGRFEVAGDQINVTYDPARSGQVWTAAVMRGSRVVYRLTAEEVRAIVGCYELRDCRGKRYP
ncbi:hypothetical protein [Methylobacterium nodulans]|uniref:Uncharacterized protein n=1 Tax=Methylobacterium nodulans (strain LMG 21967 / CNCM I-2342 / ORS 2060) TaxID=460265 RepID=B8ISF8_METNO|nr:hypothetical protein [Methylobacterium nodulans]ACL58798.1 hypothetical protein Mnod_3898 [Methylobacterium nodulans ORS 2060]